METLLFIAGGGSILAVAAGILIWRLVRNHAKKEVLADDIQEKDALLEGLEIARKGRQRYESDPTFAKWVRDRFTRK